MARRRPNRQNGKRPANRTQTTVGFDKSKASKLRLVVPKPGQFVAPSQAGSTQWIEWHPEPALLGNDRRAWLGRVDEEDRNRIVNFGDQIPKRGMGCSLKSSEGERWFVVSGPGVLVYWVLPPKRTVEKVLADTDVSIKPGALGSRGSVIYMTEK
jgi:hypothetical protein